MNLIKFVHVPCGQRPKVEFRKISDFTSAEADYGTREVKHIVFGSINYKVDPVSQKKLFKQLNKLVGS